MITVNLKDPGGLISHFAHVSSQAARALKRQAYADLVFFCSPGSAPVAGHQAVLEPLSLLLSSLFQQHHTDCGKREPVQLHLPTVPAPALTRLLDLVYTGTCTATQHQLAQLDTVMQLLDIKLPGGLLSQQMDADSLEGLEMEKASSPSSSVSSMGKGKRKFSEADLDSGAEEKRRVKADRSSSEATETVMFSCPDCPGRFRLRRALELHAARQHGVARPAGLDTTLPMKNAVGPGQHQCQACSGQFGSAWHAQPSRHGCSGGRLSSASEVSHSDSLNSSGGNSRCRLCNNTVESDWYLPPSRHHCQALTTTKDMEVQDGIVQCKQCFKMLQTEWHLPPSRHSCTESKIVYQENESACKICPEMFTSLSGLCSHYTREHFWSGLEEEFRSWDVRCSICLLEFPSSEDLIYHMGNIHRRFNKYLVADGIEEVVIGKKLQINDFTCEIPNCGVISENNNKFKRHLSESHFYKNLKREYTFESTCPATCMWSINKDEKQKNMNASNHSGITHSESLKFAAFHSTGTGNKQLFEFLFDMKKLKEGRLYEEVIRKSLNSYYCAKCKSGFQKHLQLKIHIAFSHFKEKLMKTNPGNVCGICEHTAENNDDLLKHVAEKHDSTIAYLLGKEGLTLPRKNEKWSLIQNVKPSNQDYQDGVKNEGLNCNVYNSSDRISKDVFSQKQCQLCFSCFTTAKSLKVHYYSRHYLDRVMEDSKQNFSKCFVCFKPVFHSGGPHKHGLLKHLGNHSDILLSYMKADGLWTGESETFSDDAYRVKKLRIDVKKVKSGEFVVNGTTSCGDDAEQLLRCFICSKDFHSCGYDELLAHYSVEHYRLEVEEEMRRFGVWSQDSRCPLCNIVVVSKHQLILHVGAKHKIVEKFLPIKFRKPQVEDQISTYPCPVEGCSSEKESHKSLLIHLLMVHFHNKMERDFGESFRSSGKNKKCPQCGMALLDNYLGYMKHIAVDHQHVLSFVDNNKKSDHAETNLGQLNVRSLFDSEDVVRNDV